MKKLFHFFATAVFGTFALASCVVDDTTDVTTPVHGERTITLNAQLADTRTTLADHVFNWAEDDIYGVFAVGADGANLGYYAVGVNGDAKVTLPAGTSQLYCVYPGVPAKIEDSSTADFAEQKPYSADTDLSDMKFHIPAYREASGVFDSDFHFMAAKVDLSGYGDGATVDFTFKSLVCVVELNVYDQSGSAGKINEIMVRMYGSNAAEAVGCSGDCTLDWNSLELTDFKSKSGQKAMTSVYRDSAFCDESVKNAVLGEHTSKSNGFKVYFMLPKRVYTDAYIQVRHPEEITTGDWNSLDKYTAYPNLDLTVDGRTINYDVYFDDADTAFDISVSNVTLTSADVTVAPSNDAVWYFADAVDAETVEYDFRNDLSAYVQARWEQVKDQYEDNYREFLCNGKTTQTVSLLYPGNEFAFAVVVNPETGVLYESTLDSLAFNTDEAPEPLSLELSVENGGTVKVVPSEKDAPYYVGVVLAEDVENQYAGDLDDYVSATLRKLAGDGKLSGELVKGDTEKKFDVSAFEVYYAFAVGVNTDSDSGYEWTSALVYEEFGVEGFLTVSNHKFVWEPVGGVAYYTVTFDVQPSDENTYYYWTIAATSGRSDDDDDDVVVFDAELKLTEAVNSFNDMLGDSQFEERLEELKYFLSKGSQTGLVKKQLMFETDYAFVGGYVTIEADGSLTRVSKAYVFELGNSGEDQTPKDSPYTIVNATQSAVDKTNHTARVTLMPKSDFRSGYHYFCLVVETSEMNDTATALGKKFYEDLKAQPDFDYATTSNDNFKAANSSLAFVFDAPKSLTSYTFIYGCVADDTQQIYNVESKSVTTIEY